MSSPNDLQRLLFGLLLMRYLDFQEASLKSQCISQGYSKHILIIHDICTQKLDLLHGTVLLVCLHQPQLLDNLHSALDSSENCVLAIQPWRRCQGDEELAAIGVRSCVCHAENAGTAVLQTWMNLVFELLAVDGFAATPGARRVSTLDHEVGYDAVKNLIIVVAALGKTREVLACLRSVVRVELDG
jgi:hypothetical protein